MDYTYVDCFVQVTYGIHYMVIFYSLEKKRTRNYDVLLPQMGIPSFSILPVLI